MCSAAAGGGPPVQKRFGFCTRHAGPGMDSRIQRFVLKFEPRRPRMAHGPGLNSKNIEQLESLFRTHCNDEQALQELLQAIQGRTGPDARRLRSKILRQIGNLHSGVSETESGPMRRTMRRRPPRTEGLPLPSEGRPEADRSPGQRMDVSLPDRYITALEALIEELRNSPRRKQRDLHNGKRTGAPENSPVYAFELPDQTGILDSASVDLNIAGRRVGATVLSLQPGVIVLRLAEDVGERVERAILLLDETGL